MPTYKYRLKSGCILDPDQVYKVAKSGGVSQCSYLWDAQGNSPGWIPASENFDWDGSRYVRYAGNATENTVYTIIENCSSVYTFDKEWAKDLDKDLETLMVKEKPKGYVGCETPGMSYGPTPAQANLMKQLPTKKETMLDNIIATNKAAAVQAAYLETGRIANATAANLLAKKFPGLPQTPFNALIIANLADVIGKQIKPSAKLAKITTAMVTQAYAEVYQLIDLEGMINELLNTVPGFDDGE